MIFDRLTNRTINISNLPSQIELGRFVHVDSNLELCSDTLPAESTCDIIDSFLGDIYSTSHKVLRRLSQELNGSVPCKEEIPSPIIRNVSTEIKMTSFENMLYDNIHHIKCAFNNPHYKLNRSEEKVNVSKAKRITPRSYQYLGAHTEDWQQYSIVSFRPERILTEELSLDYDIYENRLLVAFVQRTLAYLRGRVKAVSDAKTFIKDYRDSLNSYQNSLSGGDTWYAKPERSLTLFGREYHDKNYVVDNTNDDEIESTETFGKLRRLLNECVLLLGKNLVQQVNSRALESLTYHDTNVLIGHEHYKYLKQLWIELNSFSTEHSIEQQQQENQEIIHGLSSYAHSLIKYVVAKFFHYDICQLSGGLDWIATFKNGQYSAFPDIEVHDNRGVVEVSVGDKKIRFVCIVCNGIESEIPEGTFVLQYLLRSYSWPERNKMESIVPANLKDIDTVERVAIVLRSIMIRSHIRKVITGVELPSDYDFLHPEAKVRLYPDSTNVHIMENDFMVLIDDTQKIIHYFNNNSRYRRLEAKDWGMDNLYVMY